jgi:hypothetical protein
VTEIQERPPSTIKNIDIVSPGWRCRRSGSAHHQRLNGFESNQTGALWPPGSLVSSSPSPLLNGRAASRPRRPCLALLGRCRPPAVVVAGQGPPPCPLSTWYQAKPPLPFPFAPVAAPLLKGEGHRRCPISSCHDFLPSSRPRDTEVLPSPPVQAPLLESHRRIRIA